MSKESTLVVVKTVFSEWEKGLIVDRLQELGIAVRVEDFGATDRGQDVDLCLACNRENR